MGCLNLSNIQSLFKSKCRKDKKHWVLGQIYCKIKDYNKLAVTSLYQWSKDIISKEAKHIRVNEWFRAIKCINIKIYKYQSSWGLWKANQRLEGKRKKDKKYYLNFYTDWDKLSLQSWWYCKIEPKRNDADSLGLVLDIAIVSTKRRSNNIFMCYGSNNHKINRNLQSFKTSHYICCQNWLT